MKNLIYLLLSFAAITFISCGDDDGEGEGCSSSPVSGLIEGIPFEFGIGTVSTDGDMLDISLYTVADTIPDPCLGGTGQTVSIFGSVPAVVGRTDLYIDLVNFEGQTLTMFNKEGFSNIIAADGFVELTSITSTTVEGFFDINDGVSPPVDYACGTFTLSVCD